jgi:hypothetical protein
MAVNIEFKKKLDITVREGANAREIEYSLAKRNPWGKLKRRYRTGKVYAKGGSGSENKGVSKTRDARNKGVITNPRVLKVDGRTGKKVMVDG